MTNTLIDELREWDIRHCDGELCFDSRQAFDEILSRHAAPKEVELIKLWDWLETDVRLKYARTDTPHDLYQRIRNRVMGLLSEVYGSWPNPHHTPTRDTEPLAKEDKDGK